MFLNFFFLLIITLSLWTLFMSWSTYQPRCIMFLQGKIYMNFRTKRFSVELWNCGIWMRASVGAPENISRNSSPQWASTPQTTHLWLQPVDMALFLCTPTNRPQADRARREPVLQPFWSLGSDSWQSASAEHSFSGYRASVAIQSSCQELD